MKKLCLLLCSILLVVHFSGVAFCGEGPYIGINLGAAIVPDYDWDDPAFSGFSVEVESEVGLAGGVALGYGFNNNFRLEGEVVYQANDLDKITVSNIASVVMSGDTSSLAFLLNGYYDFVNDSNFTPFISAGIGYAQVNIDNMNYVGSGVPDYDDDDKVFAYQIGAGIGYAVSEKTTLDLKYRYFGTSDPEFGTSTVEYGSHNIYVGLRFGF